MVHTLDEAAKTIKKILEGHPEVFRASVFGSFAKQEQTERSDLDILVEMERPLGFGFFAIAEEIEQATGRKVDFLSPSALNLLDYGQAIRQGAVLVYEKGQATS